MNQPDYHFTSSRLGFRAWTPHDLQPCADMNRDPRVMRFFPAPLSPKTSDRLVARVQQHFARHGFGFYAVDWLEKQAFIGFLGIKQVDFEAFFTPCVEIGWRLRPEAWGKGLATEGGKRCLQHAFESLGLAEVYSFTATINRPSERVMQKIGMTKVGEFDHPKVPRGHVLERHVLYRCTGPEWQGSGS